LSSATGSTELSGLLAIPHATLFWRQKAKSELQLSRKLSNEN